MNNLTFDEMMLFAKIIAYIFGDRTVVLTNNDKEIAYEALKKLVDQRLDLTTLQKEEFKTVVEMIKRIDPNT